MTDNYIELLHELSTAPGPPGGEEPIAKIMRCHLEADCKVERDYLGSLMAIKEGASPRPRIMIAAHMDEVGFMVQHITRKGFIRLQPLGGWRANELPGCRLHIHGTMGTVDGVVATVPPHFVKEITKDITFEDLLLDIGADSQEEAAGLGVQMGDLVTPVAHFAILNGKYLMNKAWDDRAGCAAMVAALFGLATHPNTVVAAATVQEEVGSRGAQTAVTVVKPDVAVVLEGAPADDLPETGKDEPQGALGAGCQIRLFDPSTIIHRRFWQWVTSLAEEKGIACQKAVRRSGATDARVIHVAHAGVPTVVLAVPVRYAHSHNGLIHLADFKATVALTRSILEHLTESVYASFLPR